jgi:hypothetical protein
MESGLLVVRQVHWKAEVMSKQPGTRSQGHAQLAVGGIFTVAAGVGAAIAWSKWYAAIRAPSLSTVSLNSLSSGLATNHGFESRNGDLGTVAAIALALAGLALLVKWMSRISLVIIPVASAGLIAIGGAELVAGIRAYESWTSFLNHLPSTLNGFGYAFVASTVGGVTQSISWSSIAPSGGAIIAGVVGVIATFITLTGYYKSRTPVLSNPAPALRAVATAGPTSAFAPATHATTLRRDAEPCHVCAATVPAGAQFCGECGEHV